MIPINMVTDRQLTGLGLDPTEVRRLEEELAQMGLGLGISVGGVFRGIKRGVKGVAKGVVKGARFAGKQAIKVAPYAIGAGAAGIAGKALVPVALRAVKRIVRKPAVAPRAPAVAAREALMKMKPTVAEARRPPSIPEAEAQIAAEKPPSILERLKEAVLPLVPQVAERITAPPVQIPEPALPPSVAPAVTPPAPPGAPPVTAAGFDPKLLLMGLPLLFMAMGRK